MSLLSIFFQIEAFGIQDIDGSDGGLNGFGLVISIMKGWRQLQNKGV